MSKSSFIIMGTILVIVGVGGIFLSSDFLDTAKNSATVVLTQEEFDTTKQEFLSLVNFEDPKVSLGILRERIKTDDSLARFCHELVHEIGHEAYKKYGDFGEAMQYQDEICNSGYLHGVIESHFLSADDLAETMGTTCDQFESGTFANWECVHGVGHGLMFFTGNDLPGSIEMCETLSTQFQKSSCINGAFMENFNVDQKVHVSEYLNSEDLFYPCNEQSSRHKSDCYLYAPTQFLSKNVNQYEEALEWCETAEEKFIPTCVSGVGSEVMKQNINDPKLVENICMNNTDRTDSCIGGMVALHINHFGGLVETRALCDELRPENKGICESIVESRETLFE